MLRVRVTHLKEEYLKRNGVWHSDKIELTQYLIRRGDYLTYLVIAYDPVYLSEPLVRSTEYRLNVNQQIPPYPCTVVNEVDRPKGVVPHYLPGTNNDITWFSRRYGIPDGRGDGRRRATCIRRFARRSRARMGGFGPEPPPRRRRSLEPSVPPRAPDSSSRRRGMRRSPVRWWVAVGIAVATQAPLVGAGADHRALTAGPCTD